MAHQRRVIGGVFRKLRGYAFCEVRKNFVLSLSVSFFLT